MAAVVACRLVVDAKAAALALALGSAHTGGVGEAVAEERGGGGNSAGHSRALPAIAVTPASLLCLEAAPKQGWLWRAGYGRAEATRR